jgi:eukaryotic-like serine/threonine-protein kinase
MSSNPATDDTQASDATLPAQARPARGDSLLGRSFGRFVVARRIGAGGMGAVYAAHDPELDREVAIKVLLPTRVEDLRGRDRMLREAQSLARLSHPNVVQIYDVGKTDELVWLAMELVAGQTLAAWLARDPPPPWRDVVDAFVQAGRGLAAAHDVGLVHRDFKPHNALVSPERGHPLGRVRVLDFGLARLVDDEAEGERTPATSIEVTRTGDMIGTPAYMAPEQLRGEPADARTDQYNFCASLFQGLYGVRPFSGEDVASLTHATLEGEIVARPAGRRVPGRIEAAVMRGLARDPADRFVSMDALLDELRPPQRRALVIGGALLVAAGIAAVVIVTREPGALERCLDAASSTRPAWDDAARERTRSAFMATQAAYAAPSFERIDRTLARYGDEIVAARTSTCRDTYETATQSAAMFDLRSSCLERARTSADAATAVLETADAETVRNAVRIADGLPALSRCEDTDALAAAVPPPSDPATAERVAGLRGHLDRASALDRASKYADGLAEAQSVAAEASRVEYRPLQLEAELAIAQAERSLGQLDEATSRMREIYWRALGAGLDAIAYEAAWKLTADLGPHQQKTDEAKVWLRNALALHERSDAGEIERARLLGLDADLRKLAAELRAAEPLYQQAIAICKALGARALEGKLHNDYWDLLRQEGRWAESEAEIERALATSRELYGEGHPETAKPLLNSAIAAINREDYTTCETRARAALAILEAALPPDSPDLATALNVLGVALLEQQRLDEARTVLKRGLAIREKASGDAHRETIMYLNNLGRLEWLAYDLPAAMAYQQRAHEAAIAMLGEHHPLVANTYTSLGSTLWDMHDYAGSAKHLEAALKILERDDLDPNLRARTQFLLARSLWEIGERERATALARAAHATLSTTEGASEPRNALAAWSEKVGLAL